MKKAIILSILAAIMITTTLSCGKKTPDLKTQTENFIYALDSVSTPDDMNRFHARYDDFYNQLRKEAANPDSEIRQLAFTALQKYFDVEEAALITSTEGNFDNTVLFLLAGTYMAKLPYVTSVNELYRIQYTMATMYLAHNPFEEGLMKEKSEETINLLLKFIKERREEIKSGNIYDTKWHQNVDLQEE